MARRSFADQLHARGLARDVAGGAAFGSGVGIDIGAGGVDLGHRLGHGGISRAADEAQIAVALFAHDAGGLGAIDSNLVAGLIVLGGAVDPFTTAARGLPTLNSEAERMTEFVRLAKFYPAARLVFSGGSGSLHPASVSEAAVARLFFARQGVDTERVLFEDRSRNTYENVLLSEKLAKPKPGEVWLLVQSARDVPRAVGVFRKLGWPVIAVPVAYKTGRSGAADFTGNLDLLNNSIHEWLGLVVYRLTGKTDELFPGP